MSVHDARIRRWLSPSVLAVAVTLAAGIPGAPAAAARSRPDLVVASLSVAPGAAQHGATIRVTARTRNRGGALAGASRLAVLLSADRRRDRADVALDAGRRVRALPTRRAASYAHDLFIPRATVPGTYWVLACADVRNALRESSERNNCARPVRLAVTAAPLAPPSIPPSPGPALPITPGPGPGAPPGDPVPGPQPQPDPEPVTPAISIADAATVAEGGASAVFAVSLDRPTTTTVTVSWSTADDSASQPSDYVRASGSLTFAPGQTSSSVTVTPADDSVFEAQERFLVRLAFPVRATIADGEAAAAIADDDDPPSLSIADVGVSETAGSATLTVSRTGETAVPATVDWETADGTAVAASDYTARSGNVRLEPSDTSATIVVPLADDLTVEGDEAFAVRLNAPVAATIADGDATVTVGSDDVAARLRLEEVNQLLPHDLIELRVLSAGSIEGTRIDAGGRPYDVALPPIAVAAGDLVVVHTNEISTGNPAPISVESTDTSECDSAVRLACFDTAWDVAGAGNLPLSDRVITVRGPDGGYQDSVPFSNPSSAPLAFVPALQDIQAHGLWLPADCNGTLCTTSSTPTADQVSVDWSFVPNDPTYSIRRISATDTNHSQDWAIGASSFGLPNP